jgi:hypothetical protein
VASKEDLIGVKALKQQIYFIVRLFLCVKMDFPVGLKIISIHLFFGSLLMNTRYNKSESGSWIQIANFLKVINLS